MTLGELGPYAILIFVCFLPHEAWRWLGVLLARRVDENSEILVWVRAVATAILAGVVAKIVLFAPGALAGAPLWVRLASVAGGMLAFWSARKSVLAAVGAGTGLLALGDLLFGR